MKTTEQTEKTGKRKAKAHTGANKGRVAATGAKVGKKAGRGSKAASTASKPNRRTGSKTAVILDLLEREGGATGTELMEATGWQAHSVRGFLSGAVGKKMGRQVLSTKGEDGQRRYALQH